MKFTTLNYEKKADYAIISLNRPDKLNALNNQVFTDLDNLITDIELDYKVKAVILTGTGDKAFAAGADIKELHKSDELTGLHFSEHGSKVMNRLENLKIPVIAAVNGFALGGGCELSLSCHIRFASDNAKFGQPEVNLGIIPGYGGTQRLPKIIGKAKAMELILTGNIVDAEEAKRIGLVNDVYPQNELLERVEDFVKLILTKSDAAVKAAVETVNISERLSLREGLEFESRRFAQVCGTEDFKEGTLAFLEKRKPDFKGK